MKKIMFLIVMLTLSYVSYATPSNPVPEQKVEVIFTATVNGVECNDGVSYEVYWYSSLNEYVVKFFNNTSYWADIEYQYRVKDSETSSHWRDGFASCSAGGTSDYNPAGEWGDVQNVTYTSK